MLNYVTFTLWTTFTWNIGDRVTHFSKRCKFIFYWGMDRNLPKPKMSITHFIVFKLLKKLKKPTKNTCYYLIKNGLAKSLFWFNKHSIFTKCTDEIKMMASSKVNCVSINLKCAYWLLLVQCFIYMVIHNCECRSRNVNPPPLFNRRTQGKAVEDIIAHVQTYPIVKMVCAVSSRKSTYVFHLWSKYKLVSLIFRLANIRNWQSITIARCYSGLASF